MKSRAKLEERSSSLSSTVASGGYESAYLSADSHGHIEQPVQQPHVIADSAPRDVLRRYALLKLPTLSPLTSWSFILKCWHPGMQFGPKAGICKSEGCEGSRDRYRCVAESRKRITATCRSWLKFEPLSHAKTALQSQQFPF